MTIQTQSTSAQSLQVLVKKEGVMKIWNRYKVKQFSTIMFPEKKNKKKQI